MRKLKILQYFANSTAPNAFVKFVKVTNDTGLWDAEITW